MKKAGNVIIISLALVYFLVRGPWRGVREGLMDHQLMYATSLAWRMLYIHEAWAVLFISLLLLHAMKLQKHTLSHGDALATKRLQTA